MLFRALRLATPSGAGLVACVAASVLVGRLWRSAAARRLQRDNDLTVSNSEAFPSKPPAPDIVARLDVVAPRVECESSSDDCSFCLDQLVAPGAGCVRIPECGHAFHSNCLETWVFHRAEAFLDWRNYTLQEDGVVVQDVSVLPPTCPNCGKDLGVISSDLLEQTLLTTIARSLSFGDLSSAADLMNSGLVRYEEDVIRNGIQSYSSEPIVYLGTGNGRISDTRSPSSLSSLRSSVTLAGVGDHAAHRPLLAFGIKVD